MKILQGLSGLKIVGADIVEVAPGYDTQGLYRLSMPHRTCADATADEITQIAAANIGWQILTLMAKTPLVA